jgi:hypothetical protein
MTQASGRGAFVPLAFAPGGDFQFDWSEEWAVLGGERVRLQVAHTELSHSLDFIVRAYLLQTRMSVLTLWIALADSIGAKETDSASAIAIQDTTTVIDRDTMEVHGVRTRLGAFDAPESSHLCMDAASNRSHCDQKLAITLEDLIRGYVMTCGLTPQNTKLRCASSSLQSRIQTSQII